jgi:hypothetical protein
LLDFARDTEGWSVLVGGDTTLVVGQKTISSSRSRRISRTPRDNARPRGGNVVLVVHSVLLKGFYYLIDKNRSTTAHVPFDTVTVSSDTAGPPRKVFRKFNVPVVTRFARKETDLRDGREEKKKR